MRKASSSFDNLERPDVKRMRREDHRNEPFMQSIAPRPVEIPAYDVVSVGNISSLTSESGPRRCSAPSASSRNTAWAQSNTSAHDTITALLEEARVNARINQVRDELLRREVISRLGLHTYLSDQNNEMPPPPPTPAVDPAVLLLVQKLMTGPQQQQAPHLNYQAPLNPTVLATLLQPTQEQQPRPTDAANSSNPLLDSVISLLQTKISSSFAVQALLALTGRPGEQAPPPVVPENPGFDAARLSALTSLVATLGNGVNDPNIAGATIVSRATTRDVKCQSPISMVSDADVETLSEYQCLLREQMDLFEASTEDVKVTAQGRNKPIFLRQVGIQCKHCAHLPPKQRPRGAVYYPARLSSIYQSAQNMGVNHFNGRCPNIPESISINLDNLKNKKSLLHGGGKKYWAEKANAVGVVEVENGLEFNGQKAQAF